MKKLLACLLLAACGDDGGSSSGESLPLENFADRLATTSCSMQFECCSSDEIMEMYDGITFEGEPITTESQCVSFATALLESFAVAGYQESIAMGRMEYNADAAGDCVAAIEALSCAEYGSDNPLATTGCRPFLIPKVGDGGGCLQDYECISNNCEGAETSIGEDPVDGACAPMPGLGQECDENCEDGLYCKSTIENPMDSCQPLEENGAECRFDDDCESDNCDDDSLCADKPQTCVGG